MQNESYEYQSLCDQAASVLKSGGLVALPTETVYGLAALVSIPTACAKIFEVKKRPFFDPLIVHVAEPSWISQIADDQSERALIEKLSVFWPGPLTLILKRSHWIPSIVTSGLDTVAVRIPSHPFAKQLLLTLNEPFAAPSANEFGRLSPTKAIHVQSSLKEGVDLIVDLPGCESGIESTILDLSKPGHLYLRRPGAIAREEIEQRIGLRLENFSNATQLAPGETFAHYATKTPLKLLSRNELESANEDETKDIGLLAFSKCIPSYADCMTLSESGSVREAATHLFDRLFELDQKQLKEIWVEKIPETGLGEAIMNRLKKAANTFA